jgi:Domain of unknown function (DUF4349)
MSDDTATMERDLAAVEAALASGVATDENPISRELQELALQLRADAPRPRDEFAAELRGRVDEGFPRGGDARARQQAALERLSAKAAKAPGALSSAVRDVLLPVGGVAVGILLIVGLVLIAGGSNGGSDDSDAGAGGGGSVATLESGGDDSGGGGAGEKAEEPALSQRSAGADAGAVAPAEPPPSGGGFAPGQRNRKIERSFSLELDVPLDDMARVADRVSAVTYRHGGFVLNSSVNSGEDDGGGDFSLRIPRDRLRPALRDLAELAPVIRQSQEGRDVTREHVTAKDRLQAARAERRSLLRRLEEADTDEEAEAIRRQLDLVAGEINGLRAQLRDLRLRTDYAVVNVSLVAGDNDDNGSGVGGSFDDAMDDAGGLLVGLAGVLIRVLALAVPLGLIALAGWLGTRGLRRRRRESALA